MMEHILKYVESLDEFVATHQINGEMENEFLGSLRPGMSREKYVNLVLRRCFPNLRKLRRGFGEIDDNEFKEHLYDIAIEVNPHLAIESLTARSVKPRKPEDTHKVDFPTYFSERVFGQPQVIEPLNTAILSYKTGIRNHDKPPGVFTLVGPTGVGKTETAEVFAEYLFGSRQHCLAIQGTEFQLRHQVTNLLGAPKSYLGYSDKTILQKFFEEHQEGVILLDEMDKAHSSVRKAFLQAMDKGVITDNKGEELNFRNIFLFFATNTGGRALEDLEQRIGFSRKSREEISTKEYEEFFLEQLKKTVEPEFMGRNGRILVFRPFSREVAAQVAQKLLDREREYHSNGNVFTKFDRTVALAVAEQANFRDYGGRDMESIIESQIRMPLLNALTSGEIKKDEAIEFRGSQDKIRIVIANRLKSHTDEK